MIVHKETIIQMAKEVEKRPPEEPEEPKECEE